MAFDGITTKAIVDELQNIIGSKIDKIHEPDKNTIILGLYLNGKNYALNIGLTYDIEATECWDNPISITSKTTSTIANIESRLNRYKNIEGFESVCIWYEKCGENDYNLYIGYA